MNKPDREKSRRTPKCVGGDSGAYHCEFADSDLGGDKPFVADDPADVPFEAHWLHWSTARKWPVHLAVAWVAYPSRADIVRQGQKPTRFPREQEARAEVIAALIAGRLVAYGVPDPGMPWDPHHEIPAERWRGLDLRGSRTLSEPALDRGRGGRVAFRNVEVETSRLFTLWPEASVQAVAGVSTEARTDDVAVEPAMEPSKYQAEPSTAAIGAMAGPSESQKGPLRGDSLRTFVRAVVPSPGLSKNALFDWLQEEARKIGRTVHRPSVRDEIHGSDIYPDVAPRGRRRPRPD